MSIQLTGVPIAEIDPTTRRIVRVFGVLDELPYIGKPNFIVKPDLTSFATTDELRYATIASAATAAVKIPQATIDAEKAADAQKAAEAQAANEAARAQWEVDEFARLFKEGTTPEALAIRILLKWSGKTLEDALSERERILNP
jgi:hypothetical protein